MSDHPEIPPDEELFDEEFEHDLAFVRESFAEAAPIEPSDEAFLRQSNDIMALVASPPATASEPADESWWKSLKRRWKESFTFRIGAFVTAAAAAIALFVLLQPTTSVDENTAPDERSAPEIAVGDDDEVPAPEPDAVPDSGSPTEVAADDELHDDDDQIEDDKDFGETLDDETGMSASMAALDDIDADVLSELEFVTDTLLEGDESELWASLDTTESGQGYDLDQLSDDELLLLESELESGELFLP